MSCWRKDHFWSINPKINPTQTQSSFNKSREGDVWHHDVNEQLNQSHSDRTDTRQWEDLVLSRGEGWCWWWWWGGGEVRWGEVGGGGVSLLGRCLLNPTLFYSHMFHNMRHDDCRGVWTKRNLPPRPYSDLSIRSALRSAGGHLLMRRGASTTSSDYRFLLVTRTNRIQLATN